MKEIKVALFGIGGFAANYIHALANPHRPGVHLVGAVDPFVRECALCPVYASAEELYAAQRPDLVIIGTPIQFHAAQAIAAFQHGCHVVVEKPLSADLASAQAMLQARDAAGKQLSVGFQLCYDPAMQALKRDVEVGVYGQPVSLRAIVLWPRNLAYYRRGSGWAGKKYDAAGNAVFDSVLSNATAHYLMNMLFVTGAPAALTDCVTYRANAIETYDTAVVKAVSKTGAELFIAVSHVAGEAHVQDPLLEYRFERGTIRFGAPGCRGERLTGVLANGQTRDYGVVGMGNMENVWNMVDVLREGAPVGCPGEVALWHVDVLEQMRCFQPEAIEIPAAYVREENEMRWVPGLAEELWRCYDKCALPADGLWTDAGGR